jgi:hypothetical protein
MQEGKGLGDRIPQLTGVQLEGWDLGFESWKELVSKFLTDVGWQTEVVPFQQAGDKAVPVQGVDNLGLKQERRRRKMALYNEKLDDIAKRRITHQ